MVAHTHQRLGDDLDLEALVEDARRLVMAHMGSRIAAAHADPDDVMQEVYLRLVRAQRSSKSRWDGSRGLSRSTYLYKVGRCAALNALRSHGRWDRELPTDPMTMGDVSSLDPAGESTDAAMERILSVLDLPEEKAMARHLADGRTLPEIQKRMGISEDTAKELRTRVRALLMGLRQD